MPEERMPNFQKMSITQLRSEVVGRYGKPSLKLLEGTGKQGYISAMIHGERALRWISKGKNASEKKSITNAILDHGKDIIDAAEFHGKSVFDLANWYKTSYLLSLLHHPNQAHSVFEKFGDIVGKKITVKNVRNTKTSLLFKTLVKLDHKDPESHRVVRDLIDELLH